MLQINNAMNIYLKLYAQAGLRPTPDGHFEMRPTEVTTWRVGNKVSERLELIAGPIGMMSGCPPDRIIGIIETVSHGADNKYHGLGAITTIEYLGVSGGYIPKKRRIIIRTDGEKATREDMLRFGSFKKRRGLWVHTKEIEQIPTEYFLKNVND